MSAFMPLTMFPYPDEGDREPDDSRYYPGALEAERVPDDLMECDGCKELRPCVVIERHCCNVFLCSDCLATYAEAGKAHAARLQAQAAQAQSVPGLL